MRLCEWEECNAMVDGWGDSPAEVHCMECVSQGLREYAEEYSGEVTPETLIGAFLDSAHRGGFVPAVVSGVLCDVCGKGVAV